MTLPEAFKEPPFETLLAEYKQAAIEYVSARDAEKATVLQEAFDNESELLAQITESFVLKRQAEIREQNYWALQMFRKFVTETNMVDLLALQYGLKRQVLVPEDSSVFPPKPAVMEPNDDLLRRFDLAPYQFHTTGTRMGYKFHALTLDERPTIKISSEPDAVTMRFEFPKESGPAKVKDANARMIEPNSGKVTVAVLSRETPGGSASPELITQVGNYLNRDDIAQESDDITVKSGIPKPFRIEATLYTGGDPAKDVSSEDATKSAWDFAEAAHRLGGYVDRLELGHVFYELGVQRVAITEPAADMSCNWDEAPHCQEVVIHVRAE